MDHLRTTQVPSPPPPTPPSRVGLYYLAAILLVVLCGAVGVLGILYVRPDADNTQMILAYIGFCGIALTQLVNFIKISDVKTTTQETHVLVNSQMAELKRTIAELEYAKGVTEGISQQRDIAKAMKIEQSLDKERAERTEIKDAVLSLKDALPAAPDKSAAVAAAHMAVALAEEKAKMEEAIRKMDKEKKLDDPTREKT